MNNELEEKESKKEYKDFSSITYILACIFIVLMTGVVYFIIYFITFTILGSDITIGEIVLWSITTYLLVWVTVLLLMVLNLSVSIDKLKDKEKEKE